MIYLYKITNKLNKKIYIGVHKTDDINDGYMGSNSELKEDINILGTDNFIKQMLMEFDSYTEALELESIIVDESFRDRLDTYNKNIGGFGGWEHIEWTEDRRADRSKKYTGTTNPFYGRKHSDATKEVLAVKASKQWSGVPKTEEHRSKIRAALSGIPLSEERKKKISEANKGRTPYNKGVKAVKWICPHCGKTGGGEGNRTRYHFDNCKERKL